MGVFRMGLKMLLLRRSFLKEGLGWAMHCRRRCATAGLGASIRSVILEDFALGGFLAHLGAILAHLGLQDAPKTLQDASKTLQNASKSLQDTPKTPPREAKKP